MLPGFVGRQVTVSRVQSKTNNIGYTNRDVYYDARFPGGKFAPPCFPGTTCDPGTTETDVGVAISAIDELVATAMSWFRDSKSVLLFP
jgi:hypothetical protein